MPRAPKSVGGKLLLVANLAAANAAAAAAVVGFARPSVLDSIAGFESTRRITIGLETPMAWLVFAAAIVLLLANFAWLVRPKAQATAEAFVLSQAPGGVVRIAREALESALQRTADTVPMLTRARVRVTLPGRSRVVVHAQYCCAEGAGSLAVSQRLRGALASRCEELVRLGEGGKVEFELEFLGFQGKLGKEALAAQAEDEEVPFTGPKYPIDDEEQGDLR